MGRKYEYVAAFGDLGVGFDIVGPFATKAEAEAFSREHASPQAVHAVPAPTGKDYAASSLQSYAIRAHRDDPRVFDLAVRAHRRPDAKAPD
jgi:hypothetical protein